MKYITKRPLAESIGIVRSKFDYLKMIKFGVLASMVHYVITRLLLKSALPALLILGNPEKIAGVVMTGCLVSYPVILTILIIQQKKVYNRNVISANEVINDTVDDMNSMGLEVSKEDVLNASVLLEDHKEKYLREEGYYTYDQSLIKLKTRKEKLMVLRECTTKLQKFAYIEATPDRTVSLLDENEYELEDVNRKQLIK